MAHPVSRDDFFYDGTMFYVEIEGKHRHPRCDASSLHGLLTYTPGPLLTKKGQVAKRQPPPHKDPPAHFYTAQMIHYGLKPLKTRDPAKKKLLAAFDGGATLAVPAHILQLEQQLATEFAVSGKGAAGPPKTKAKAKAKGAKQAGLAVTFAEQEQPKDVPQVARGSKAARKPAPVVDEPALRSSLEGLAHRDLVHIIMRIADDADVYRSVFEHVRKLQAAATPLPPLDSGPPRTKAPSGQHARKNSQPQKPSELFPPLEVSSDLDELTDGMHDTPPRVSRNKNRAGQTGASATVAKAQSSSGAAPLMGVYDVSVPYLEEQWPDSFGYERHALLKVRPSSTGAHLWGSFDFGPVTGFFKSYGAAPTSVGSKSELRWRGRDEGSGEMQLFEEEQVGYVKFLADGRIQGRIEGSFFGKADFTGELKEANINVQDVQEWKDEWRSMNESSYEAARVGRWGGWGGDPEPDKPDASDTEEDEMDSDDDHDDSDGSADEVF